MNILGALIPISLFLGGLGLAAFLWSLHARQYDDIEGDQHRALFGGHDEQPKRDPLALQRKVTRRSDPKGG